MNDKFIALIIAVASGIMLLTTGDGSPLDPEEWLIDRGDSADQVRLRLIRRGIGWRNEHSANIPLKDLQGLTRGQMDSVRSSVQFDILRDAGRLHCEGTFVAGTGQGRVTFTPNPAMRPELERLGYESPSDDNLYAMAVRDIGLDFAREFGQVGGRPAVSDLIRLRDHGVRMETVRELRDMGYDFGPSDLVRLQDHGADSAFLRDMKALAFTGSVEDLVRYRDHGVDARYIRAVTEGGGFSPGEIVKLHDHGVSGEFASGLKDFSFSADELIKLHSHGASEDFIRQMREAGVAPDCDDLVRLRNNGVPPDLARQARSAGYPQLSSEDLVRLHSNGVSGEYIRRIQSGGLKNLTVDQIVKLRQHGID